MGRGVQFLVAATAATLIAGAAPAAAQQSVPNPPWPRLLPPAPGTTTAVQPGPVARCRKPPRRCVDDTTRIFKRWRARYGCDPRAVFTNTSPLLPQEIKRSLRKPGFFDDRRYII